MLSNHLSHNAYMQKDILENIYTHIKISCINRTTILFPLYHLILPIIETLCTIVKCVMLGCKLLLLFEHI